MKTNRQYLENPIYDVIIIGGGITGAGIIRDATLRGMKTLLLDKGDFASGTSSRSGKLVHGGLRYLKYGHIKLVYESCKERYLLWKILAPHLVKKIRFIYPFYKFSKTPRWLAAFGIFLYSFIIIFKNLGWPQFISRKDLKILIPELKEDLLTGALGYYDCRASDSRLTIDTLKSAKERGASLVNYLEVKKIFRENDLFKLMVSDHLANGKEYQLKGRAVINATGIWADKLLDLESSKQKTNFNLKMSSGIHLTFSSNRFPLKEVVTLETREDFRNIYCVPWGNYILVGTTDQSYHGNFEEPRTSKRDVDYLLNTLAFYFPQLKLSHVDIVSETCGIRPLIGSDIGKAEKDMSRDFEIKVSPLGMISVTGGKLTTYRLMAKKTIELLIATYFKNQKWADCSTISPISGGEKINFSLDEKNKILFNRYGSNMIKVLEYQKDKRDFIPTLPYYWFEIDYMVAHEFVEHLNDFLIRRTEIFLMSPILENELLWEIANYLGKLKDWDQGRCQLEVTKYQAVIENIILVSQKSAKGMS